MNIWLILNGKPAGDPELRDAVNRTREAGITIDVHVTWESGDVGRFIAMAIEQGVERIVIGGGDGTLHEAVNALMTHEASRRPIMGIIPLGTANDFATSAGMPMTPMDALSLATDGDVSAIDVGRINDLCFLNMASGGFGAQVTSSTPAVLKKMLGGGAYSLVGAMRAWRFEPFDGRLILPSDSTEASLIVLAIGNGRQAGGGQELAPRALLDDGLLDVLVVQSFRFSEIGQAIRELESLSSEGKLVRYYQLESLRFESRQSLPVNLDGEAHEFSTACIDVLPGAINMVLPEHCPLLKANADDKGR